MVFSRYFRNVSILIRPGNFADKGEIIQIPAEQNIPSHIPIAVLAFSKHPAEAKQFIDFIVSDKGKEILKKKNYTTSLK